MNPACRGSHANEAERQALLDEVMARAGGPSALIFRNPMREQVNRVCHCLDASIGVLTRKNPGGVVPADLLGQLIEIRNSLDGMRQKFTNLVPHAKQLMAQMRHIAEYLVKVCAWGAWHAY
jgi:hypothetical protein